MNAHAGALDQILRAHEDGDLPDELAEEYGLDEDSDTFATVEYATAEGARRRVEYRRLPDHPWLALRQEFEEVDGEMRFVGSERVTELEVDGEPVVEPSGVEGP